MTGVQLIAHRGCPLRYAENSLEGFRAAIGAGARFVETDLQLTSDGVPVLFHDPDMERLCGTSGPIHDQRFAELANHRTQIPDHPAPAKHEAHIPSLDELVALLLDHPEVTLFLELKRIALIERGVEAVLDTTLPVVAPIIDQVVIISFAVDALATARKRGVKVIGAVLQSWEDRDAPILHEIAPEYLFCNIQKMPDDNPPKTLPAPHTRFAVYDIVDPDHARRLARSGIHWIETFSIDTLLPAMTESKSNG